jgi:ABC-type molybdate transport system ATPase subunit
MNQVIATVQNIEETDIVTYIHVNSGESAMYLIKSENPKWLSVGDKVYCNFQEASVCLSKDCPGKVSIENTLPVTLQNVRRNNSLCELTLNNSDFGDIISLITANAYEKLDLQKGCKATMLLRGVDIKLEPFIEHFKVSSF